MLAIFVFGQFQYLRMVNILSIADKDDRWPCLGDRYCHRLAFCNMKIKRCECKAGLIGNGVDDCHVGKIYALVIESSTNVLAYTTKSNVFLFLENSLQHRAAFHAMVTEIALRIQIARMGIVNVDMS